MNVRKPIRRKKQEQVLVRATLIVMTVLIAVLSGLCISLRGRVKKLEGQLEVLKDGSNKSVEIVWSEDNIFPEAESEPEEEAETELEDGKKRVYLTFDDGPSVYTEEILKILREYNVKATFFVTGMKEAKYQKWYQKIIEEGHTLGIHTYSHVYSDIYSSLEAFQTDFNKLRNHLYEQTGEWINLYRFPGGSGNNVVTAQNRKAILEWMDSEEILYYDWNVSPEETGRKKPTAQEIAKICLEGIEECNTAMVLLHDAGGRKSTVEALPLIIEGVKQMEDAMLLPITEETVTLQQISLTKE